MYFTLQFTDSQASGFRCGFMLQFTDSQDEYCGAMLQVSWISLRFHTAVSLSKSCCFRGDWYASSHGSLHRQIYAALCGSLHRQICTSQAFPSLHRQIYAALCGSLHRKICTSQAFPSLHTPSHAFTKTHACITIRSLNGIKP